MTYNNTFDASKDYTAVRVNYGQTLVSHEINELQSIVQEKFNDGFGTLFEEGLIFTGFDIVQDANNILTLNPGIVKLDGLPRSINTVSNLDYSTILTDVFDIYAYVAYYKITSSDDTNLNHPTSPDLPVGDREKATVLLSITDPSTLTQPTNFLRLTKIKILEYNKVTKVLTAISRNTSGYINLSKLPGQIQTSQIAPGTIDTEQFNVVLDGLPLKQAIAVRTDDAEGSFVAWGGNVVYQDNIIVGDTQGIKISLEAFRAYVQGFQIQFKEARSYFLDHTTAVKDRLNESKTYTTGTLSYSLVKNPASEIVSLDADVTVTSQNITRGAGDFDTLLNTPVVSVSSVVQGMTTYVANTDYQLNGDQIQWLGGGSRPTQGTTYQVTYVYRRAFIIGTDIILATNRKQLTFTGTVLPVNNSTFQVTYRYYLPRIDSLFVDSTGQITVKKGVPDELPKAPVVPDGVLELAQITVPPASHLGNTYLSANSYAIPSGSSINYVTVQVPATKMRDHQRRNITLTNLAFNDTINTAVNYLVTQDPTSAKVGTFGDRFYDDRLSDYGQLTQNIVFDTERRVGIGARAKNIVPLQHDGNLPPQIRENKGFVTLNYTESPSLSQLKWSDTVDLQPYMYDVETRIIDVPNKNLVIGQKFRIYGYNWPVGEDSIEFFLNGIKLTSITIVTGTTGSQSDSVTADANRRFVVEFAVPNNLPIGYRVLRAQSYVTGNWVETLLGVQTAAAPVPPPRSTTFVNTKCNEIRYILNHGIGGQQQYLIKKHPVLGEIQKFDCGSGQWVFVSYWDPIVQTFIPDQDQFLTAVDLYFTSKDTQSDVYVSIIQTDNGIPDTTQGRIGTAIVPPSSIVTNGNATKVTFDNPVFVKAGVPYGLFVECPTSGYSIQFARLGKLDRSSYDVTPQGFRTFTSQTSNPIGPLPASPVNNRRTHSTTYRWQTKTYTFTPLENVTIYQIVSNVYVGPDALSNNALAQFQIKDTTNNTVIWSTNRVLNSVTNPYTGKFTANGFQDLVGSRGTGDIISAPISLIANRQYEFKVSANTGYAYPYIRDNYPDDGVANVKLYAFTPATKTYEKIKENALTSGQLFFSPDGIVWQGYPDSDLRFKLYKAQFPVNTQYVINMKKFSTSPGPSEVNMLDSATHFTSLLSAVTPQNTDVLVEYSLDNGNTWFPHIPVVFKEQPQADDSKDRETWAFYNYGFFNEQRFKENQFDVKFIPSNPNKSVSFGTLTAGVNYRLKLRTTNPNVTPVLDSKNWSIQFEKYGLSTTYFSRTQITQTDVDSAKVYFWAIIPSGVTYTVSLTLDGENTNPTYVNKTSPSATRIIDSSVNLIEYRFDYSSANLSAQSVKNRPKLKLVFTTSDRFAQPEVRFVGFNVFPA